MKSILLFLSVLCAISTYSQSSQNNTGQQSSTDSTYSEVLLNGHAALMIQISSFNKRSAIFGGGGLALTINRNLFVGLYGLKMLNEITEDVPDSMLTNLQIDFTHGGLWAGYNFAPEEKVQFTLSAMLGVGSVRADEIEFKDRVAVFAPMVGVQFRPLNWMGIEINGGYRLMNKVNSTPLFTKRNLSAPFANFMLKFGGFD